jgi:hypothetical protein
VFKKVTGIHPLKYRTFISSWYAMLLKRYLILITL